MSSHPVCGESQSRTCGLKSGAAVTRIALRFGLGLVLGVIVLASTGCLGRSPVVNHYLLGSDSSSGTISTDGQPAAGYGPAVLIGPVRLPAYLDRPQMARLTTGGAVELDEFARWIGGFEENFLRALTLGVGNRLNSVRVVSHPSKAPFDFDTRIRLHIDELVVVDDARLRVRIRWAVKGFAADPSLHLMQESIPLSDDSARGIVAAHDAVISDLADRISSQIAAASERLATEPEMGPDTTPAEDPIEP